MNISSPRAPRSSHHRRTSSTRSSPRSQRVRPFGGNYPNQPNYEGSRLPSPQIPENLHDDRGTFNVDPTAPILEAGGETYQEPIAPAGRRNFVGGFVGGLRKAWRNRGPGEGAAGERIAYPEPAVVNDEETQYEPVAPAEPEMRYATPVPQEALYSSPLPDASHAALSPGVHYATPVQYTSGPRDAELPTSPIREDHHREESSSSVSETVHGATTQEHYEGTTIVNHDILPNDMGSPQYVEPQPGPDYAKLSPPRSEASFGSYLTRMHRFFRTINDLPWIAADRVTVDYIPGKARQNEVLPGGRPRPGRRHAVISWYNSNAPQPSIDLLSSGSASGYGSARGGFASPLAEFPQAHEVMKSPEARYAEPVGLNHPRPGPPPMTMAATAQSAVSQPRANRVSRVPVPQWSPEPSDTDPYFFESPRYPNGGYVPYEQLDPGQMAHTYTGSSMASSLGSPVVHHPVSPRPI